MTSYLSPHFKYMIFDVFTYHIELLLATNQKERFSGNRLPILALHQSKSDVSGF